MKLLSQNLHVSWCLLLIGIYKITNLVNGKVYIGKSIDIATRFSNHRSVAFNPNEDRYEYPLYRSIRKYGLENFLFEVIEECSVEELDEKEMFYIAKFKSHGPLGYNQDDGGFGGSHNYKLNQDDVNQIVHRLKTTNDTIKSIGDDFGISETAVRRINRGIAWHNDNENYPIRQDALSIVIDQLNANCDSTKCYLCGKEVSTNLSACKTCSHLLQRKVIDRPSPIELAKMIKEAGFSEVGRNLGVSCNTIKHWCKNYQIPYKLKELIAWYNKQMGIIEPPKPAKRKMEDIVRPVKQVDPSSNEVIATFESCRAAARYLIDQGRSASITTITTCIGRAISGRLKTAYGYIWELA